MADVAACAQEQTEELLALQSIFAEDCLVDSEEPGSVAYSLRIPVDFGFGDDHDIRVSVERDQDSMVPEPAEGGESQVDHLAQLQDFSVLELARKQILGQPASSLKPIRIEPSETGSHWQSTIKHLPPLTLQVSYPSDYPEVSEPAFHLESSWLNSEQLACLCAELDARAAEMPGLPIVFTWAELLRSETVSLLGLSDRLLLSPSGEVEDLRAIAECADPLASLLELAKYDQGKDLEIWQQQQHCCFICFSEKPGSAYVPLGCGHYFCAECISDMARLHVSEGSILELKCPTPDCRKEIAASTLQQVLDDDGFDRWLRLKTAQVLQSGLEGVVFCPRCEENDIQAPTLCDKAKSPEEAPVAECPRCSYIFCGKCLAVAHPYVADCVPEEERMMAVALRKLEGQTLNPAEKRKQQRQLQRALKTHLLVIERFGSLPRVDAAGYVVEDFETMKEGDEIICIAVPGRRADEEKVIWEKNKDGLESQDAALQFVNDSDLLVRFSAPSASSAALRMRQKKAMEELLSLRALKQDSQACPKCKVRISRSQGCNHMHCTSCGTHFCYKCGAWMNPVDPYSHFKTTSCQTFDTAEVQRIQAEERRGGVDRELEELRRQFGHQEDLFAQFQNRQFGQPARRRRNVGEHRQGQSCCPTCRQWNDRAGQLNHVRCMFCRTSYCHCCGRRIDGVITNHFRGEGACPQHGNRPAE